MLVTLWGCEVKISKENLQGKWELVRYEATNPNFPYLIDAVKEAFLSNIYVLNPDHSYEIIKDNQTIEKGNWDLANDKQLLFTSTGAKKKKYSIAKLTKGKIELFDSEKFAMTAISIQLNRKDD